MTKEQLGYSRRSVLKKGAVVTSALVVGGTAVTGKTVAGIGDDRVGHYNLNNLHLNKDTEQKIKNHVHDASPEKNHGTNDGAEVVKDGAVGNAFAFDGDSSEVVVPSSQTLNPAEQVTVAGWVESHRRHVCRLRQQRSCWQIERKCWWCAICTLDKHRW